MLLSNMDFSGAGNAAVKIYRMLKRNNFDCSLYVNEKKTKYSKKFSLSFKERVKEDFRKLIGSTNPEDAEKGTVRKLFATSMGENAIHGSDSEDNAHIESSFFFNKNEMY